MVKGIYGASAVEIITFLVACQWKMLPDNEGLDILSKAPIVAPGIMPKVDVNAQSSIEGLTECFQQLEMKLVERTAPRVRSDSPIAPRMCYMCSEAGYSMSPNLEVDTSSVLSSPAEVIPSIRSNRESLLEKIRPPP